MKGKLKRLTDLPNEALIELLLQQDGVDNILAELAEPKEVQYPEDPIKFVEETLGQTLWAAQKDIMYSVRDNRFTVVESGNGIGKTYVAAAITCWWLTLHKEAIVLSTANTWNQINNLLWREIRTLGRGAKVRLPGRILDTPRWEISSNRYGAGISTRKATNEDVTAMLGSHSPYLLVIMDEAPGLQRQIWNTIMRLVTGSENRILAIGNPIAQEGAFYEATQNPAWHHIRVSCLDHPNVVEDRDVIPGAVSRIWVHERVSDWGYACEPETPGGIEILGRWILPLPVFLSSVLGEPPEEQEDQLIPFRLIKESQVLWQEIDSGGPIVLGVDPARFGSAKSAIACRAGNKALWIRRREGQDVTNVAGWVQDVMEETGATNVKVDEIGIGAGVVSILRSKGYPVEGVNFSGTAVQRTRFVNMRAETYWNVRVALRQGKLALPEDTLLSGDLTAVRYTYDMHGRVELERKDQIETRLGRSVDSGDSLALTYANVMVPLDGEGSDARIVKAHSDELTFGDTGSRWIIDRGNRRTRSRWKVS